MPARKLVCCSRGLGLLTSPDGVESQRPETTKVFHKNIFLVRDHLRDITRHHVIVVTKFVVVGASWTSIGRSALVGLPRATLPVRSPVTHGHIVPYRTTFAKHCHRSSHATQADFVINGSPVLRDRVRTVPFSNTAMRQPQSIPPAPSSQDRARLLLLSAREHRRSQRLGPRVSPV